MVALGWLGHIEFSKQPIQPATEPDLFFYDVGVNFTSFRACERIQPYAEGSEEKEPGFEIRYLQSECNYFLARAMFMDSFCDRVRPVGVGMKDGSKFTPSFCKKQIFAPSGGLALIGAEKTLQPVDSGPGTFSTDLVWTSDSSGAESKMQMMRAVGYGDQKVRDFLLGGHPNSRPISSDYAPAA